MRKHSISALAVAALVAAPTLTAAPAYAQTGNPLNSIFRCDAGGNKQAGGAAIGAVVGGLIGNKVADNERGLGTVLGAAIGAAAGSYIGCRMQVSDQQRAQAAAQQALNSGQNTTWTNPQTGASGQYTVVSTQPYTGPGYTATPYSQTQPTSMANMRFAAGVQPASSYEGASGRYQSSTTVNIRSTPATSGAILGKLRAGEPIDALARVRGYNSTWILAGRNGVAIGYVAESVLRPAPQGYAAAPVNQGPMCRTFDQTVTASGETQTQRYTACQTASGEWVVQG